MMEISVGLSRFDHASAVKPHSHRQWEFVFCQGASGWMDVGSQRLRHVDGDLVILRPHLIHDAYSTGAADHLCIRAVSAEIFGIEEGVITIDSGLRRVLDQMHEEMQQKDAFRDQIIELEAKEAVLRIRRLLSRHVGFEHLVAENLAERIRMVIDEEFTQSIDLGLLAKRLGYSRDHIRHVFSAAYGTSPIDYLISRRLACAADLLRDSELSVKDIAVSCGFNDEYYFSRRFKKWSGHAPGRFRGSQRT